VNGAILFETADNVLRVPAAAVIRGNFVLLKLAEGQTEEAARQEHALSSGASAAGSGRPGGSFGGADGTGGTQGGTPPDRGTFGGADGTRGEGGPPSGAAPTADAGGAGNSAAAQPPAASDSEETAPAEIPADAASEGSYVSRMEAPAGYVYIQVRTGINDETWIEITDGLREGDVVATQVNISDTNNSGFFGVGSNMGGMSGGARPAMPAGGGPSFSRSIG
jgi:hypothetical protein